MNDKKIAATIYIKRGVAYLSYDCDDEPIDVEVAALNYINSGADKLILFDLSSDDDEHEQNIMAIRKINDVSEIPTLAGGNINKLEDVKKILYAGCMQVILNGSKASTITVMEEAAKRFGKDKVIISIDNIDFLFKHSDIVSDYASELIILEPSILRLGSIEDSTSLPATVFLGDADYDYLVDILSSDTILALSGDVVRKNSIMELKSTLSDKGITFANYEAQLKWSDLSPNEDGLIPVVVQEYMSKDVLMLAYMNEESFNATIRTGKMTYYSRSRKKLWVKGETSSHTQYVKKLTADCDKDTILALVSQSGNVACHTGSRSCFFNNIVTREYIEKNPLKIFEALYDVIVDRKRNPKEGSYTNYLFDKGIDKILKKVGEEATEIVIAAKNPNTEEIKYEISDFLYHVTVLMVECGITWDEVTKELSRR